MVLLRLQTRDLIVTLQERGSLYTSIFLDQNWAHQRFFGWRMRQDGEFFRVLEKQVGPFSRSLILMRQFPMEEDRHLIGRQGERGLLHETVLHDFSNDSRDHAWLSAQGFHPAADSERLLNTSTFVIDLGAPPDTLLQAMTADYRRKIRKATAGGVSVRILPAPDRVLLNDFVERLRAFSRAVHFQIPGQEVLQAMYASGRAVLAVVEDGRGPLGYLHVYLAGPTGFFMYGVMLAKHNDGAGQFLHWQIMVWLRENGYRWYDLGGLPSQNPEDGIFRFKSGFGGMMTPLGTEWIKRGAAYAAAARLRHAFSNQGRGQ